MKCCKCDSNYEEHYYRYDDDIYCFDCLTEELEDEGRLNIVERTNYYNDDWRELGTDNDISEVIQNLCEIYDVKELGWEEN